MHHKRLMAKVNRLSTSHRLTIFKIVGNFGLYPGQFPILKFIYQHEPCSQKDIADFLQVSAPSIAVSVRRMEKAGWIVKSCDPNDQRYNRLTITPKGKEITLLCHREFETLDERLFASFSAEERDQFSLYLDRLIQHLNTDEFQHATYFSLIQKEKEYRRKAEEDVPND